MAFTKNNINEIFGTVLVLSALLSTASAVDCHGKSFHCVNSTHFMICVDLGGGVSQAIENFFIACPPPTICQGTNHYECEFPAPTTPVATTRNVITEATLPWEEVVTAYSTGNTTEEFSENYMNTERITTAAEYSMTTDTTVEVTVTTALDFNFAGTNQLPTIPVDIAPNALEAVSDNSSIYVTGATAKATTAAVVGNVTQTTAATRRLTEIEPATIEITTSRIIDTTAQTVTENVVITETVTTEVDHVPQIATDQIIQTSSEKPVELDTVQLNIEVPQIVDWFQNETLKNTTTSKDPKTIDNINAHNIEKDLSNKHLSTVANRDTMIPITHEPNVLVTEGSFRNDLQTGSKSTIKLVTDATKNKMKHLTTMPVAKITTYEYPSSTNVYETELQKNNRVEETSLNQDNETMKHLPTGILAHKTPETSQTDYTLQESSTIINEWIDGVNPTTSLVGDLFPEVVITTNMPFIYEENTKENVLATTDQTQVADNNNTVAAISNQVVVLTTEHPTNLTTSDGAFSSKQITAINVEMLTSSTTQTVAAVDLNVITTEAVPISTTISNASAMVTETPLLTTNMQNPVDTTLEGNAVITERPIITNEESLIMDVTQNVTIENTNIPITQEVNLDSAITEASNMHSNNIKDSVTSKPLLLVTHNFSDTLFDGALTTETIQNGASFYESPTSINKGAVDTIKNIPVYVTGIPPNQAANLDKINTEDKEAMSISTENNNNQMVPTTSKASAVSGTQLLTTQKMLEEFYLDGAVTEAVHNSAVTEQRNVHDISFTTDTIRRIVTDENNQITIPPVVNITERDGLYTPNTITGKQPSVSASQDNTSHKHQKNTTQSPNFASATLVDAALTANKLDHDADASTVHPTTMNEEKLALSSAQNAVSVNTINPSNQTVHVDMITTEAVNMPTKINNAQAMHPGFEDNNIDKTPLSVLDDVVSKVNTEDLTNDFITTPMQLVNKTDDVPFTNVVEPSFNKEHAIIGNEDKVVKNDSNNIISNGVTEDQGHIEFASSSSNDFKMENNTNLDQINNTLSHLELTSTTKYGNLETSQTGIKDNSASNVYLGPREELTSTTKNNLPNATVILNTDEPIFHAGPSGAENIEETLLPSTQGSKNVIVPTQSTDSINIDQDKYGKLYPNVVAVNVDQTFENANEQALSHAFETPQTGRSPITDNFNKENANNQQSKSETILATNSVQLGTQPSTTEINVQTAKSKPNPESTSKSSVTNPNIGTNGNMEALGSSIQDKYQSNSIASNVALGPQEESTSTMENNVPNPTVSYNTDKSTLHTVQSGADNIETTLLQSSQSSKHVNVPTQSTDAINIDQDKYGKLYPNMVAVNVDLTLENASEQAFSHAFETPQTGRSPITDNLNTANAKNEQSKSETILATNSVQQGAQPSTAEINVQTAKSKPNPESTSKSSVTNVNIGTNGNMEALESSIQDKSQSNSNASNVSLGPQEELTSTMEINVSNPTVSYNTDKSTLHTVQSGADNIETTLLQSSQSSKHVIVPTQSTDAINVDQDKYGKLHPNVVAVNVEQTLENANEQAFSHAFETPQTGRSPITDSFNTVNANNQQSKSETILATNSVQPGTQPSTTEINVQTAKSKPNQESTSKSSVTNVNIGTNGNMEALESSIQDKSQSNSITSNVALGPQEELTSTMENNVPNPTVSYNTDKSTLHTVQSGADNIETTLLQSSQSSKHVNVPTQSTDAINIDQDKYGKLYPNMVAVNVDLTLENASEQAFSHAFETPQTGRSPITDNLNTANAKNQQSKTETILATNSVQLGTQPSTTEINVQTAKSKSNPESTSKLSVTNVNIGANGNMEALESSIQDKSQSNSNASNVSLGPQEELTSIMENNVPNPTVSYNTGKSTLHTVQSGADNIETTLLQSSQSSKHVIVPSQSTGAINIDQDKLKKLCPNVEAVNADQMYENADNINQNSEFTNKSSVTRINAGENYTSTVNYDTQFVSEQSPTSSITTGRSIKAKVNEQIIKDTTSSIKISTSNVLAPNDHLETVTELNSVHETYSNRGLKTEVPVRNNGLDLTSPTTASAKINAANNAIITSTQNKYNTVSTLSPSVSTIDGMGNNIREAEKSATVISDNQENKNSQSIKETIISNNLSTADKPKEKVNTFSKPILDKLPLSNQHNKLNTDVTNMPPLTDLTYNSQTENTIIVTEPYIPASLNPITYTNTRVLVYSNGIGISTASTILRPSLNSQTGIINTGNYVYLPKNHSLESSTSTVMLPLETIDKNNNIPLVSTLEGAAFNSPIETDVFLQQSPQVAKKFINESSVEKGPSVTETNKKNTILISTSTESTKVGISTESVLAETIYTSQKHIPEYSIVNSVYPNNNSTVSKNTSETNYIQLTSIGTQKIHTNTVQSSAKTVTSIPISHVSNHQDKKIPSETDRTYTCFNGIRGRYSDKDNCRRFYLCIGNNQPIVGNCPENTVFSDINKLCTKNLSHCIRENEFKCPSAGRFSDFMKDAIYYVCINHNNHLYRFKFQCQKGYILNKTTVNCIETKEIESNESVSISSSDNSSQTGITGVGSSNTNSKTTRTKNGSSTVGNVSSKNDDSTKIKQRTETSDISEAKEDEDDYEVFKCKKEGKFPIRDECRKYYLCKKNRKEYRRKIKKCDSDSVFHKDKKKCVDADSYECE